VRRRLPIRGSTWSGRRRRSQRRAADPGERALDELQAWWSKRQAVLIRNSDRFG